MQILFKCLTVIGCILIASGAHASDYSDMSLTAVTTMGLIGVLLFYIGLKGSKIIN